MTTMQKLLSTVAVLTALVSPVQAGDPVRIEVVNGWVIEYWPDSFAGACTATGNYPNSMPGASNGPTKLEFVRIYNDENNNAIEWGIMLINKSWKTKGLTFEVVMEINARGQPKRTVPMVFRGFGDNGGMVAAGLSIEAMNQLAFDTEAGVKFIGKRDGKVFAHLRIDNSAKQIRAVVNCLKSREPTTQVAKQDNTRTVPKQENTNTGPYFGTGFFVAPKYILTSYHVVEKCIGQIHVKYPTYRSEKAYISSYDKKVDLALLKTDMPHRAIAQFRLRGKLGESVASYGFPYGNVLSTSGNFTLGNVSALSGPEDDSSMIQVSTPIQPGNSGGPLMDSSGVIIGVSEGIFGTLEMAKLAGGAVPQNVNFGVSSGTAITFLGTRNIDAEIASLTPKLEPEKLAEHAMQFTVQISCDSPALNKGS
jgi:serine protease Do